MTVPRRHAASSCLPLSISCPLKLTEARTSALNMPFGCCGCASRMVALREHSAVVVDRAFLAARFQLVPAFFVPCRAALGLLRRVLGHAERAGQPHAKLLIAIKAL